MSLTRPQVAVLGLVMSAAPALAFTPIPTIPTPPIYNLCVGYVPTLQDCQTGTTFCAQLARSSAKTNPNATCNVLVRDAALDAVASLPERTVLVPVTRNASGQTVEPDVATKPVAFIEEDANGRSMNGLAGFLLGTAHRDQTYFPATSQSAGWIKFLRALQLAGWDNSGTTVDSCQEYVHEKYYDYSVFEFATASVGTDYRRIHGLAFAAAPSGGAVPATAIGTRAIQDPVQRGKDGTPIQPAIQFPAGAPKNEFFTVPAPAQGKVIISSSNQDRVVPLPGVMGGAIIELKDLHRSLNLYGTVLPAAMRTTLSQGASYYNESWSWHRAMSTRNAAVLDEQLYSLDQLQEDFAALIQQRKDRVAAIQSELALRFRPIPGMLQAPSTDTSSNLSGDEPQDPIITRAYELAALDDVIEAALQQAQARGCLAFQTGKMPAPCDWSPKRFARRVMNLYQGAREQDFQKCARYTRDDFADLKAKALVHGGVNFPAQNYTTSPSRLETYFTRRDQYLRALSTTVGTMLDPKTAQPRLRWESGDSYSLGNDTFGATANYQVAVAINNVKNTPDCGLSPEVTGSFDATGSALGISANLIHAQTQVTQKRADIDLDVLDNTVPLVDVHRDLALGQFNIVSGKQEKSATLVSAQATFVIVVVPVTLGAKVAGVVGLDYRLTAEHQVTGTTQCSVTSLGVAGHLEPFARVDGEMYAAVDLFIIEAGVKGRLQLVHAAVPLDASAYLTSSGGRLKLRMEGNSHLRFTFLAGRISAYVEVGIWPFEVEFEQTLVSWNGIKEDVKLFDHAFNVDLVDIRSLL
ncbi:hypothetical protein [Myxococcus sp. SDU36]|uniref:hypothetical protein n=1 Tax=Myxococcus sp. SDU36 TaxID=2831967 RepID=UPI002543CCE2|nr:hypothetical protein [Myxococcus sp. SDU36]WIG94073.1 DUF1943 domain-containing protein [Myxococcus sp. SDU36]